MADGIGFQFDARQIEKTLGKIAKDVLPAAQAGFLNSIAFTARKGLLDYADKTIVGKPTAWTRKGFVVDKTKESDGRSMYSTVRLQPSQAAYMQYLVNGGVRKAGDPGATKYDVLVDADAEDKDRFGNVKRGYLKRVARKAKAEKLKRAKLAAKRAKLRAAGKSTLPARWSTNNPSGAPGVFFGKVGGVRGYWERARKREGDYRLKLLVRFSDKAAYRPSFRWNETILKSIASKNPQKVFDAELARAIRKLR